MRASLPVLLLAAALATGWLGACGAAPGSGWWAVDRGAGCVLRLDAELIVRERMSLPGVERALTHAGRTWLATGGERGELFTLEPRAPRHLWSAPGAILALAPAAGEGLLVLEGRAGAARRLWSVAPDGAALLLGAFPDAHVLASDGAAVLVGGLGGRLVELGAGGAQRAQEHVPGGVRALAPGPRRGTWWLLAGGPAPRLELRGAGLALVRGVLAGAAGSALATDPERAQVWLVAGDALWRHGLEGEAEAVLVLAQGPWSAAAATAEGVLLLAPGALLEVRARGASARVLRAQGGFAALSALVPLSAP
ncbi:MAG TPA: hypothetical protein VF530_06020 [Planctomycetota bacterium]